MTRRQLVTAFVLLRAGSARGAEPDAQCERLRRRIEELRLKLRMGYSASEGRRWRLQLEGLEREYRALCR